MTSDGRYKGKGKEREVALDSGDEDPIRMTTAPLDLEVVHCPVRAGAVDPRLQNERFIRTHYQALDQDGYVPSSRLILSD
jgi:hypothetical protein